MKIGLITTIDTNIGDDFIRRGICKLLAAHYNDKVEFIPVNKHFPYTVYPTWHPAYLGQISENFPQVKNRLQSLVDRYFSSIGHSRFDHCDLIVQCGAPVFWFNCNLNEWATPIWHDVIKRLCDDIPVLNLAAGSCYPWKKQDIAFDNPLDVEYMKSILGYCRMTTVRDELAQSICGRLGWKTPRVPCAAILAADQQDPSDTSESYILINYMRGGGHYDFQQGVDDSKWERTIKELIVRLERRHKVAMICHDSKEENLAMELAPSLTKYFPKSPQEYFECIAGAKLGVCNRMHASVGMAGLGIPSVAIGTDTRLLMVKETGLPVHYVDDVSVDTLETQLEDILSNKAHERDRLLTLRKETWGKYMSILGEVLS